jgi:SAM-dependent methyltransferase
MNRELPAEYYDKLYSDPGHYGVHFRKSSYYPLFKRVLGELQDAHATSVLEVGCGSGTLAHMIMTLLPQVEYRGFDFSQTAVSRAIARTGRLGALYVGDAKAPEAYIGDYDSIICTEVLEHIDDDLAVIGNWRAGIPCICSVPNFPYEGHVRFFRNEREVQARYGELIDIGSIRRIAKPVMGEGTFRDYLRRLRWSRDDLKKFLGLLGINTFDNLAGWFVFAGRRSI